MIKYFFIFVIGFIFNPVAKSQDTNERLLITWLAQQTRDSVNFVRVLSLMEDLDYPIKNNKLKLIEGGIYEFYNIRSHAQHFLFLYQDSKIVIVNEYSPNKILQLYWERESLIKKDKIKLKLLEGLVNFIYQKSILPETVE